MLSPWHTSGTSVQVALTRGMSDEDPGYQFGGGLGVADDPIWKNGSLRPGRVSASEEKKNDRHTNFDVISVSQVKKIPFEESTPLSIRVTRTMFSSVTPTHFARHLTVNQPTYHRSKNLYQALTQIRPSNTILTKGSKLRSSADFNESQKWKLHGVPGSS